MRPEQRMEVKLDREYVQSLAAKANPVKQTGQSNEKKKCEVCSPPDLSFARTDICIEVKNDNHRQAARRIHSERRDCRLFGARAEPAPQPLRVARSARVPARRVEGGHQHVPVNDGRGQI